MGGGGWLGGSGACLWRSTSGDGPQAAVRAPVADRGARCWGAGGFYVVVCVLYVCVYYLGAPSWCKSACLEGGSLVMQLEVHPVQVTSVAEREAGGKAGELRTSLEAENAAPLSRVCVRG